MRPRILCAALLVCLLAAGCSTYVTVESRPEGARITDLSGSVEYGIAPVEVAYPTDELEARGGKIPGFRATWPSGAKAETTAELVPAPKRGLTVTLERPKGAPGYEKDLEFALERASERAKRAEAERERMELYLDSRPYGFWFRPFP